MGFLYLLTWGHPNTDKLNGSARHVWSHRNLKNICILFVSNHYLYPAAPVIGAMSLASGYLWGLAPLGNLRASAGPARADGRPVPLA